jgi:hypothetical protein
MTIWSWVPRSWTARLAQSILASRSPDAGYRRIRSIWARSGIVYRGPVSYGATLTLQYALLEGYLLRWREAAAPALRTGLADPDEIVAAYCIVGLGMIGQRTSPSSVPSSGRQIPWALGSLVGRATLAEVAEFSDPAGPSAVVVTADQ